MNFSKSKSQNTFFLFVYKGSKGDVFMKDIFMWRLQKNIDHPPYSPPVFIYFFHICRLFLYSSLFFLMLSHFLTLVFNLRSIVGAKRQHQKILDIDRRLHLCRALDLDACVVQFCKTNITIRPSVLYCH
jgi:hypothetical protein